MIMQAKTSFAGPTVTFLGAAQSVTGSMHLVALGGRKFLLDCGASRSPNAHSHLKKGSFPFSPNEIEAVILSHAHMDHCGNLPYLVRHGFTGPIYCTQATRDLLAVVLHDSAKVRDEQTAIARIINPAESSNGFLQTDVHQTLQQCIPVPYEHPVAVAPDVQLRFVNAGHILGSAMANLTMTCDGKDYRLTYTGDVGRHGMPMLGNPSPTPDADLLICESTYGGRLHDSIEKTSEALGEVVRRTVERNGKVLIPAFSLGRMQLVLHCLLEKMHAGRTPTVPIFVDSPLASRIAEVHRLHSECWNGAADHPNGKRAGLLDSPWVQYLESTEVSWELLERREPCVIMAASGMCDAGRIIRHLKHNLDDPRCTVVLVSYQAPHTLGAKLLHPRPKLRIHGRDCNFWAEVVDLNGFSAHADQNDLLALIGPLAGRTKKVRLVHGEPEQARALAEAIQSRGFTDVAVPGPGEMVGLGT